MKIEGSGAVVSGGASGLGEATVRRLHEAGAQVVIADVNPEKGEPLAEELGIAFVQCDVREEDQVQSAVDKAAEAERGLRIAVSCAGTGIPIKVASSKGPHPLDAFKVIIDINLVGTFNVVRLAAARMAETPLDGDERGVIIMTASIAAFDGQIGQAAYSASKGGVVGMTLPLARDLAQHRIRVVSIAPGLFLTPMVESLPSEAITSLGAQVPHPNRLGHPSEFAQLVEHIVVNPMLNGEVIRLDGAIRMAPR